MSAFDDAFDNSFDSAPLIPPLESGAASFAAEISVVNPLVFDSSAGRLQWSVTVMIGAINVSARLTGQLKISAGEDSARLASFSLVPETAGDLNAYDSAAVTIDLTLFRPGQTATFRRFTGRVESVEFNAASRVADISCRDGWQERPKACASASAVEALFGGLAQPCPNVLKWSTDEPDPATYFNGLLDTMTGATCIDSSGVWQAVPWTIGSPVVTFSAADIFDGSLRLSRPNRADVPAAIVATLNHRYSRLHAASVIVTWANTFPLDRLLVDRLPWATKSMIQSALDGVSGWLIKGEVTMTGPTPGISIVDVHGVDTIFLVSSQMSEAYCESLQATMYRRWYQEVEVHYRVEIDMAGLSDRDESISASVDSTFDASAWESQQSAQSSVGLYLANPPFADPPTGFEGLSVPWPPENGALDHHADVTPGALGSAANYVVARALRKAVLGKRKQVVEFERPIDPRWEIGAVLAVSAYGVAATGQVAEFEDRLDFDSGDAVSSITLACPDGSGTTTGFSAGLSAVGNSVVHNFSMAPLGTFIGAADDTVAYADDALQGFLCNVQPASGSPWPQYSTYDDTKPVYQPQFRILMPDIPAPVRDPLEIEAAITATVQIAGSGVGVAF